MNCLIRLFSPSIIFFAFAAKTTSAPPFDVSKRACSLSPQTPNGFIQQMTEPRRMQTKLPYKFSITFLKKNVNVSKYGAIQTNKHGDKAGYDEHTHTHTDRVGFVSKVLTTISDRPISTVWVM